MAQVSGKDPNTDKHLSSTLAEPNRFRVWWNRKGQLGNKHSTVETIRDRQGAPLWFIHPQHGKGVDVVALPVTPHVDTEMYPINEMPSMDLRLTIGMDAFVLGYPFGIGPAGLPVWKRGSFASEPDLFPGQLFTLIDTASRPGMSGSPVIRRSFGTHLLANGDVAMAAGDASKFCGVYSGRITSKDATDAQLGMMWPAPLVSEIALAAKLDR